MSAITYDTKPESRFTEKAIFMVILTVWFGLAAAAGMTGVFTAGPDALVRPILLSVAVPVATFLAFYVGSKRFQNYILTRDIHFLTMLQSWRVLGFTFLMLYAWGTLPGFFAWPAGVGDVLLGLSAPMIVLTLIRRPDFVKSRRFIVWNLLGLFDFIVAAGTAMLTAGSIPSLISGTVTSGPMEIWPLNLFPSFGVPIFIILHLTVLFQVMKMRRGM
ncbi:MAG: hypothetical protein HOB79_21870 [Rhodospirillaceae bacterium]|jgi:hypothetical protein|nr:hypothetical protein [Rhodospirillales bacterium]MBT3907243.1 hypothetical protein [Rhodospirillaceae bacterium]MBT4703729.1 hypothetical protein [Rhodospirillaceae bacterium]MBT5036764.1 hypothetical protein [Rhodospirillaceae bacterium]MBT6220355.1 hypothetical protein [Rhodospirillaceae bacterium]